MARVWAYLGESFNDLSDKDKEMLGNLQKSGKFSKKEIMAFKKSLVARQYDEKLLQSAVDLHKADTSRSVKDWYAFLEQHAET